MNFASTSGSRSLPSNTVANPKGELKDITTRSGLVLDRPIVPTSPPFINPKEDEHVEETVTDPDLGVYHHGPTSSCLKIQALISKGLCYASKGSSSSEFPLSFKDAQKMLKALLSNKEKLQELENTPLNENCSVVILKKLPEKLRDPGKFLIPCGFSKLKFKALADLSASINLMSLFVWKKIARDVFISVGKFTFPADFVIIDYESDPRVPLILGRPLLQIACALIDVHGEEMILHDGDERLTLNMRH
nr:hypothetical protein [Tanacetum cinerariifolium]